jgi:hypothetical protein
MDASTASLTVGSDFFALPVFEIADEWKISLKDIAV